MKKLSFSRKKLKNFLKNSMHRNSNGSVKKPSGAQKKPGIDLSTLIQSVNGGKYHNCRPLESNCQQRQTNKDTL